MYIILYALLSPLAKLFTINSVKRAYVSRIKSLKGMPNTKNGHGKKPDRGYRPVTVPLEDEEEKKFNPNNNYPLRRQQEIRSYNDIPRARECDGMGQEIGRRSKVVKMKQTITDVEKEIQMFNEDRDIVKIVLDIRNLGEQIDALSNRDYGSMSDGNQILSNSGGNSHTNAQSRTVNQPNLGVEVSRQNMYQINSENGNEIPVARKIIFISLFKLIL
jgi:hypothetical protein